MPDFTTRSAGVEIMDDLECSGEVVHQTLRELEVINTWLGGNKVTLDGVAELLATHCAEREITVADLGCGGGDMLRLLNHWTKKKKIHARFTGIDANPNIIRFARQNLDDLPEITFLALDIFSTEFQRMRFDVVIGTLFYHHFDNYQLSTFFSSLKEQTNIGFVVNDIHRHPLAYYSIRWLTQWFSKSSMVKYDAPLSVLRAFRKRELIEILKNAGIKNFTIRWKWAFRWQVIVWNSPQ